MLEIIGIIAMFIIGGYMSFATFATFMMMFGLGGSVQDKVLVSLFSIFVLGYWYWWFTMLPFEIVIKG